VYKRTDRRTKMDDEFPLSKKTTERALILAKCAVKLGMKEPFAALNSNSSNDMLVYIFASETSMVIVYTTPTCYLVSHGLKDHMTAKEVDYLIVSNIKTFLQRLKKEGYKSLTKEELDELAELVKGISGEREPNDEELKEIDEEDDE
jgi:hypothetical protein